MWKLREKKLFSIQIVFTAIIFQNIAYWIQSVQNPTQYDWYNNYKSNGLTTFPHEEPHGSGHQEELSSWFRENISCPLACGVLDEHQPLLCCPVLRAQLTIAEEQQLIMIKYDDIYGSVEEQMYIILILTKQLDVRDSLLGQQDQSLPVHSVFC